MRGAPSSVLSRVSFASQTLNHPPRSSLSNSTTVRHAPLTAIESPTWQSPRMGAESPIVSVHPPASCRMSVTVPRCSIYVMYVRAYAVCMNMLVAGVSRTMVMWAVRHTRPVNMMVVVVCRQVLGVPDGLVVMVCKRDEGGIYATAVAP